MRRETAWWSRAEGLVTANPTSMSPKRPNFGLPGMELLMAHLPKENLLFLAFCLKRSIYFKNWIRPSRPETPPPGPIFYFLLHSAPPSVVSLRRIFRRFRLPCKSLVTCFVRDPILWLTKHILLRNVPWSSLDRAARGLRAESDKEPAWRPEWGERGSKPHVVVGGHVLQFALLATASP